MKIAQLTLNHFRAFYGQYNKSVLFMRKARYENALFTRPNRLDPMPNIYSRILPKLFAYLAGVICVYHSGAERE